MDTTNQTPRPGQDAQTYADRAQEHLDALHQYPISAEAYALEGIGFALLAIREELAAGAASADDNTAFLADRLTGALEPGRARRGWLPRRWRR